MTNGGALPGRQLHASSKSPSPLEDGHDVALLFRAQRSAITICGRLSFHGLADAAVSVLVIVGL